MISAHILLAVFWLLFGILHSLLAGNAIKDKVRASAIINFRHYRIYYTIFAVITFAGVVIYQIRMNSFHLFLPTILSKVVGGIIATIGIILMAICIRKYFFSLSGLKALTTEGPASELIISGVHKYMRHPLYLGTFIFIWGLFIMIPQCSLLISNTIITAYTLYGIQLEEAKLEQEFGDQYRHYKATVPKLIPFI